MTSVSVQNFTAAGLRLLLVIPGLLLLTACGASLDTKKVALTIQDSVIKQGGLSLKEVICPEAIKPEIGQTFECVGVLDAGGVFSIPVKQQDDQGTVQWQIASIRGLLNVPELQSAVQNELQKEKNTGQVTVDCGRTIYRPTKPGETFECKLLKRGRATKQPGQQSGAKDNSSLSSGKTTPAAIAATDTKSATDPRQPETILITIDPTGNANWQRVLPGAIPIGTMAKTPTTATKAKPGVKSPAAKTQSKTTHNNVPDPNRPSDSEVLVD